MTLQNIMVMHKFLNLFYMLKFLTEEYKCIVNTKFDYKYTIYVYKLYIIYMYNMYYTYELYIYNIKL